MDVRDGRALFGADKIREDANSLARQIVRKLENEGDRVIMLGYITCAEEITIFGPEAKELRERAALGIASMIDPLDDSTDGKG